jgi:soluble lytic murein transglycosylase
MKDHIGPSAPTVYDLRDWGIAYPPAFLEHAHRWGAKYGVSPCLAQAIMRQESAFKPRVSSWVGAVGLMQLMPGTANTVSDDFLDGRYISRGRLQRPETNVQLGTIYIRALTAYTRGRVPMALAGYNAGPAPLNSWFDRYGDREIDAWVESITYKQARGYARKVYTNYIRYSVLYANQLPELHLTLPDDFDEWGEVPELKQGTEEGEPVSRLRRP